MERTCEHFESGGAACYNQDEARLCELKLGRLGTFTLSQQRHPTTDSLLQQQEYTHTQNMGEIVRIRSCLSGRLFVRYVLTVPVSYTEDFIKPSSSTTLLL